MGQLPQLQQARRRLGLALNGICHDRWVLGYLRAGWVQPIAASEVSRRFLQGRPLMPLARRALYEKRAMVMNSLVENPNPSLGFDWELDWPALLYAPVGEEGERPIGILILGCRRDHWYTDEDVDYASVLGLSLTEGGGAPGAARTSERKRGRGGSAAQLRPHDTRDRAGHPGRRPQNALSRGKR